MDAVTMTVCTRLLDGSRCYSVVHLVACVIERGLSQRYCYNGRGQATTVTPGST